MLHIEWAMSTTSGPVVGRADTAGVDAALDAVAASLRAVLPSWGPEHADAFARLRRAAAAALMSGDRFEHRSAGVSVLLTRSG